MTGLSDLRSSTEIGAVSLSTRSRLRVRPLWSNGLRCGQAFLDPHDSVLEYHVIPHDHYASYIEAGGLRIDVDGAGCPVLLELDLKQSSVLLDSTLEYPSVEVLQRHRFLDFPIQHKPARVTVNNHNGLYHIVLSRRIPVERWIFAPGAAWEIDADSCLVGIWLGDVVEDPSGCRRAAWRAGIWRAYRQGRLADLASLESRPEAGWLSLPKIFP
jgi:hypothetical protein